MTDIGEGVLQKVKDEILANPKLSLPKICANLDLKYSTIYRHVSKPEFMQDIREAVQANFKIGSLGASQALIDMSLDEETPHNARVNASKAVVDFGGFSVNPSELQEIDSTTATPEELAKLMQELNKKLGSFTDEIAPKVINSDD